MHGADLAFLQQFQCDGGAGFGVGEGVVVVEEGVAAGGGDGVELVVGKAAAEVAAGGGQDAVFHLIPDIREERGILRIVRAEAMDLLAEPGVVVRVRMNETVEGVHHFPIAHDDDAHGADAAGAAVGGFEIDANQVGCHNQQKYGILTRTTNSLGGVLWSY